MFRISSLIIVILIAAQSPLTASAQDPLDDRIRALLAEGLALSEVSVRRYDEAMVRYSEADRLAANSRDGRLRAMARFRKAQAYLNTDRAVEGVATGREAAALARAAGALDLAGSALRSVGGSLVTLARFEEAEATLKEAASLAAQYGSSDDLVRATNNLSVNARYQGRLGDAIAYARESVAVLDRALAEGERVTDAMHFSPPFNLGKALADSGDYTDSRAHLERAFTAAERFGNIGGQMHVLFDTGEWYEAQGDLERAERYYRRSIEFNRVHPSFEGSGKGFRGLGRILLATGRTADSVVAFTEAVRQFDLGHIALHLSPTLVELARAKSMAGDAGGADRELERAIRLSESQHHLVGGVLALLERGRQRARGGDLAGAHADFEQAAIRATRDRLMPLVPAALAGRAVVAEARGDLAASLQSYGAAADALERIRGRIVAIELRSSYGVAARETFAGLIRVLMALHANDPRGGYDARALAALERERSQALDLAVIEARSTAARGPSATAEVRIAQIQNALFAPDLSNTIRQPLLRALDDAERDLTLEQRAPPAAGHDGMPLPRPPITLASLQSALRVDDTVVEYAGQAAFVVTREAMRIVHLDLPADLDARIDFFVRALESNARDASLASGRALAAVLIDPILPSIAPNARLLIVASGSIARLPFAALPMPDGHGHAVPMLTRHEVAYLPSLTIFESRRSNATAALARKVLLVADATSADAETRSFKRLPASRGEARFVAGLLSDARVMIAAEATEPAIKEAAAQGYPVLHLATHTLLDPDVPERSAILLGAEGDDDGLLQSREIYQLPLGGSLIVLTGCRTADGHTAGADGLRSLSRAFLQAGGRTVVGSLWDLPDRSAAHIMRTFYAELNEDGDAGSALRVAQLTIAGADPYAQSRTWAAMVLLGDPSTTLASRPQGYAGWLPSIVVLLLAGCLVISRR